MPTARLSAVVRWSVKWQRLRQEASIRSVDGLARLPHASFLQLVCRTNGQNLFSEPRKSYEG